MYLENCIHESYRSTPIDNDIRFLYDRILDHCSAPRFGCFASFISVRLSAICQYVKMSVFM